MFKVNKLTDYATLLLVNMAGNTDVNFSAKVLATNTGLTLATVGKILKILVLNKILISHQGSQGGYRLARAPEAISVADIILAMEGRKGIIECVHDADNCDLKATCPVRDPWQKINLAVYQVLEGMSLNDMLR